MSKIICDVCGTTYPETASHCPICGCAKAGAAQTAAGRTGGEEASYSHVRGGRFSKSNVRKRTQTASAAAAAAGASRRREPEKKQEKDNNRPLVIAIALLILAIVLVIAYMLISYAIPKKDAGNNGGSSQQSSIPCTGIVLSESDISFDGRDCQWLLAITKTPANTTDKVTFQSSNTAVATVSTEGLILPVAPGEATITVTCGKATAQCKVVCNFNEQVQPQPSEPSTPTVPDDVDPDFEFKFNTKYTDSQTGYADVSLSNDYRTWRAYRNDMTVSPDDITWISDNEDVCTVERGIVTATGKGTTYIHAEYKGKRFSCVVRSNADPKTETVTGNKLDVTDVTLTIGGNDAFNLHLQNSQGINISVTWQVSEEGYVSISGNRITGVQSTLELPKRYITVFCEHEGVKYECIVRVRPKETAI